MGGPAGSEVARALGLTQVAPQRWFVELRLLTISHVPTHGLPLFRDRVSEESYTTHGGQADENVSSQTKLHLGKHRNLYSFSACNVFKFLIFSKEKIINIHHLKLNKFLVIEIRMKNLFCKD